MGSRDVLVRCVQANDCIGVGCISEAHGSEPASGGLASAEGVLWELLVVQNCISLSILFGCPVLLLLSLPGGGQLASIAGKGDP